MIPEEIRKIIAEWSVHDIYDKWEKWAYEASLFAFKFAIRKAREESNARIKEINDFTRPREPTKDPEDPLVYTPKAKDMR